MGEEKVDIGTLISNPADAVRYINQCLGITATKHPLSFLDSQQIIERIEKPSRGSLQEDTFQEVFQYGIAVCIRHEKVLWKARTIIELSLELVGMSFDGHIHRKTLEKFLTFLRDDYSK